MTLVPRRVIAGLIPVLFVPGPATAQNLTLPEINQGYLEGLSCSSAVTQQDRRRCVQEQQERRQQLGGEEPQSPQQQQQQQQQQ